MEPSSAQLSGLLVMKQCERNFVKVTYIFLITMEMHLRYNGLKYRYYCWRIACCHRLPFSRQLSHESIYSLAGFTLHVVHMPPFLARSRADRELPLFFSAHSLQQLPSYGARSALHTQHLPSLLAWSRANFELPLFLPAHLLQQVPSSGYRSALHAKHLFSLFNDSLLALFWRALSFVKHSLHSLPFTAGLAHCLHFLLLVHASLLSEFSPVVDLSWNRPEILFRFEGSGSAGLRILLSSIIGD